jgi:YVTN family beta-propeller protein
MNRGRCLMKSYSRALGKVSAYTILALFLFLLATAGCNSSSDDERVSKTHARAYVSNFEDGTIKVIDTSPNNVVKTIDLSHNAGYSAVLPASNRLYVTGLASDDLSMIDTHNNKIIKHVHLPGRAGAIVADAETGTLFVAEYGNGDNFPPILPLGHRIWVLDAYDLSLVIELSCGTDLQNLALDAQNRCVYATDYGNGTDPGVVFPIDADTWTIRESITCGVRPCGVAACPSKDALYVANRDDDTVTVIDTGDGSITTTINVGSSPSSVSVDSSLDIAAVTNSDDNTVTLFNTASNLVFPLYSALAVDDFPIWSAADSSRHEIFVANMNSDNVWVVSLQNGGTQAKIPVGTMPFCVSLIP